MLQPRSVDDDWPGYSTRGHGLDRSKVKAIVERELEPLKDRLGIAHWKTWVTYDSKERRENGDFQRGVCEWRVDYNTAAINLNPEAFEDDEENEVAKVLRHELEHIIAAPYSIVYNMLRCLLESEPKAWEMLDSAWTHASEQCVINIDRMYRGLSEPTQGETS